MHELSIATKLVELVTDHLPSGDVKVLSVRLRIGAISCVHADSLRFSFELVTRGTPLQRAALQIDTVPVSIYCTICNSIETIEGIQSFRCPTCQTPSADIRSGQELELQSIELIEEETEHSLH
jgi:hydrogenase nickel incorporation protein HypA/HybF